MIHIFVQFAAGAAAAIGAIFVGNRIVEKTTGKSIRKHLIEWWNDVYADIQRWLDAHRHLNIARVAAVIARAVDQGVLTANQMLKIVFQAEPTNCEPVVISERTLSAQQIAEMFPQLRNETRIELTLET